MCSNCIAIDIWWTVCKYMQNFHSLTIIIDIPLELGHLQFALLFYHPKGREFFQIFHRISKYIQSSCDLINSGSLPTIVLVPSVTVIGRSVFSLSVMQGIPKAVVSSCKPPESVKTNFDSAIKATKSKITCWTS